jgi:hypothetical protein
MMKKKHLFLALVFIVLFQTFSVATVLGDLVNTMQPRTWKQLNTNGFTSTLLWIEGGGGADAVFNYSDDLSWNPASEEVYYIGGSHYGPGRFIIYSAATNTWRREPDPSFCTSLGHGYDHNAIDQSRQWFYHNPMSARTVVWRWEITNKRWVIGANMPTSIAVKDDLACCRGLCFYPDFALNGEKGGLIYANGRIKEVYYFGTSTGKWLNLGNVNMAGYHNIAKYNPVQKGVYLGGGNGMSTLAFLDAQGSFHQMRSAPYAVGVHSTVTTVDPVTGDLLTLAGGGTFHSYNRASDTWTSRPSSPLTTITYTCAGCITTYGVTMWCQYGSGSGRVYIYKHAQMSGGEAGSGTFTKEQMVDVYPNPFNPEIKIAVSYPAMAGSAISNVTLHIFNVNGKLVKKLTATDSRQLIAGITWNASHLSPGIYILKCTIDNKTYSRKLLLQK